MSMKVTNLFDFRNVAIQRDQSVTLMVRIQALPSPQATKRKPLNLALVLDRSGSMAGDKIDYLRRAAIELVNNLKQNDRLAVVIFDDMVETILNPQPVRDKEGIRRRLQHIDARGCTNLSGGWMEGVSHIQSVFNQDAVNRVLLLTDGLANRGVIEPERLQSIGVQARGNGITTTSFGFGADFNERLLADIADHGGGAFYFIENPDQAPAAFAEELGELLSVVGQNTTVELRLSPPVQLVSVLNPYPAEAIEGGLRIRMGDLFGDEQRELLAILGIPGLPDLGPQQVGDLTVTLDQVVDPIGQRRFEVPIEVNVVRPEDAPSQPDPEVNQTASLLKVNEVRDKVIALIDRGAFDEAYRMIEQVREMLNAQGPVTDEVANEIVRLHKELEASKTRPEYGSKHAFYARYRSGRSKGYYRK